MKNYADFTAEDFAADDDFIHWVRRPKDAAHNTFWKNWIEAHPEKMEEVEEARAMILAVAEEDQYIALPTQQTKVWQKIEATLEFADEQPGSRPRRSQWWYAAAGLVVLLGGWWLWNTPAATYGLRTTAIYGDLALYENDSKTSQTITLDDGSSVVLEPHSVLQYPHRFTEQTREVYLTGEAFFEIKKDHRRPFLVHTQELVTRVLGTSFRVRNVSGESRMMVQVATGRVSVLNQAAPGAEGGAVVLTPNQQVVYERREKKLTKSLVQQPAILQSFAGYNFEFHDVPVREVFQVLEKAYGIQIVYDDEVLANCSIHASLTGVPLYEQLTLICKGIQGSYEVIDSHIIITSKGCSD